MARAQTTIPYRQILCPVDFSDSSVSALRYAAELARRADGHLTVLFVNDPLLNAAAAAAAYNVAKLADETEAELERLIVRALGEPATSATVTTTMGYPATEIGKMAQEIGADLIVMGARGRTAPGRWLTGSVTERVLRTTEVPVLVVPKHKRQPRGAWTKALAGWPGKRVLVPIDLSDYVAANVEAALEAARSLGAQPILFSAVPPSYLPPWLSINAGAHDRQRLTIARDTMRALAGRYNADYRVAIGEPSSGIAAAATSVTARLIVITLRRSAGPLGPRRGAITYQVLCDDVAPILALPAL